MTDIRVENQIAAGSTSKNMKGSALIIILIFLSLIVLVVSVVGYVKAPVLARVIAASTADCNIPNEYRENTLKYHFEFMIAKIYRKKFWYFGIDEIIDDRQLTLSFLPISYGMYDQMCKESVISLFERFLELGFDINRKGPYRMLSGKNVEMTVLHDAVINGDAELVKYLLAKGADPNIKIRFQESTMDGKNSIEIAKILFKIENTEEKKEIVDILKYNKSL